MGKAVARKLALISLALVMMNVPLIMYAANLTLTQTIEAGELMMLEMPTDVAFPPIELEDEAVDNFAIPDTTPQEELKEEAVEVAEGAEITEPTEEKEEISTKILVEDLRFDGGFSLQVVAGRMWDKNGAGFIPVENIGIVTFYENGKQLKSQSTLAPGVSEVKTGLSGDPANTEDYVMFEPVPDNAAVSLPLTVFDGAVSGEGKGRIGQWETYPAFKLVLPADLAPGNYSGPVTYTLVSS